MEQSDTELSIFKRLLNVRRGRAKYVEIHERVRAGAQIDGIHVCQLIAAMIIASVGLNLDSTEAIVGAMLICPLMGSVIAIAYSVATVNAHFLRDAVVGLVVQIVVCLATSTAYFLLSPLGVTTSELVTNSNPTVWDVIVAFVGGFAGALGMSRKQEPGTLIAGVAVATSLMPPLCATGFGLAARDFPLAASAAYEFFVNVIFIAFGAELVFVLLRIPALRERDGKVVLTLEDMEWAEKNAGAIRKGLIVGSLLLALPCLIFSARTVRKAMVDHGSIVEAKDTYDTEMTSRELAILNPSIVSYRVGPQDSYNEGEHKLEQHIVATIETKGEISADEKSDIEQIIRLHVRDLEKVTFEIEGQDSAPAKSDAGTQAGSQANAKADSQADSQANAQANAKASS